MIMQIRHEDPSYLLDKYPDAIVTNCAGCGRLLAGRQKLTGNDPPLPAVAGHMRQRPYCDRCLQTCNPSPSRIRRFGRYDVA